MLPVLPEYRHGLCFGNSGKMQIPYGINMHVILLRLLIPLPVLPEHRHGFCFGNSGKMQIPYGINVHVVLLRSLIPLSSKDDYAKAFILLLIVLYHNSGETKTFQEETACSFHSFLKPCTYFLHIFA